MQSPEASLRRPVARAPGSLRSPIWRLLGAVNWILFIGSAASLITGRPVVREEVTNIVAGLAPALARVVEPGWFLLLWLSDFWAQHIREPLQQVLIAFNVDLAPWRFDFLLMLTFAFGAVYGAWLARTELTRGILRAAKMARQKPSIVLKPETFRQLLQARSGRRLEKDLEIVNANADRAILEVLDAALNLRPLNDHADVVINSAVVVGRAFPSLEKCALDTELPRRFEEEIVSPVRAGAHLQPEERRVLAEGLDGALGFIFAGGMRRIYFRYLAGVFQGTSAERRARVRSGIKIGVIVAIVLIVLVTLVLDYRGVMA